MFKKIVFVLFLIFIMSVEAVDVPQSTTESVKPTLNWEGFHAKGYVGTAVEYIRPPYQASPMAGFSFEYAWVVDRVFMSIEGTWLYYPQIFEIEKAVTPPIFGKTAFPGWVLLFTPIIGLHAGYMTDSNDVFTIGFAYFWGITTSYRHPINENLAFEARGTWFYDRLMSETDGFHDLHLVAGISYKF